MMAASRQLTLQNGNASNWNTRPRPSTRGARRCVHGFTATPWLSASNFVGAAHYTDAHQRGHIIRHHVRRLESLGLNVEIRELPQAG
jgi:hypothetical protein